MARLSVSIPFKREGLSEPVLALLFSAFISTRFNSLQTGRSFRTEMHYPDREYEEYCFNSLQTGRSFRTCGEWKQRHIGVKGFNSLQTGRSFRTRGFIDTVMAINRKFQFPSNGKVFPNSDDPDEIKAILKFQFPSNGKVFPNIFESIKKDKVLLLLFQFPSNGKVFPNKCVYDLNAKHGIKSFNSLQTGRSFRTSFYTSYSKTSRTCFNSLQTGRSFRTSR